MTTPPPPGSGASPQYQQMPEPGPYAQHGPEAAYAQPGWASGSPVPGNERTLAILAHLSALAAAVFSGGLMLFVGPLIVWAVADRKPFARQAAAGAFNFTLTTQIISYVAWAFVVLTLGLGLVVAIPLWIAMGVLMLWCHIRASMKASNGEHYEYPLQIRVLK